MRNDLKIGDTGNLTWTVDASMVITLGGDARATVFSTPNMIMLMERAAREALRPFLDPGEETVGIEVNIQHVGGATIGHTVRGIAKVSRIDGKKIEFEVEAFAQDRLIGKGRHTRAVVQLDRMIENLTKLSDPKLPQHQQAYGMAMSLSANTGPLPALKTIATNMRSGIATITLNRPLVLNAVDRQMTYDFEQVVCWLLGHPEIRVVLWTGAGKAFCAGDDVKELQNLPQEEARALSLRQAEMYMALERVPQTVIALIQGDAFGAGCVAAYSADMRIASHSARFAMPEVKLGWPPGYGIAQLTALVGKARALEMCLLGEPISASTALQWGLVNDVVSANNLLLRGQQVANALMALPAEAIRHTKRLVHLDEGSQPKVAYKADTDAYIRCLISPDAREGMQAFKDKRPPKFTDK